jgi:hypothetical protein
MVVDGAVIVRSQRSGVVVILALAIMFGSMVAAALGVENALVGLYAFYGLLALPMHLSWMGAKPRPARLEASGKTVRANGQVLRAHVASAKIIPQPRRGPVIELRRTVDLYPARVAVATEEQARIFVRALGLDAREGTTRFQAPLTGTPKGGVVAGFAIAFGAVLALFFAFWLADSPRAELGLIAMILVAVMSVRLLRTTITIGRDGILIDGVLGRRFVPHASIASLEREVRFNRRGPMVSRGFWANLQSGERLFLYTLNERLRDGMYEGDFLFDAASTAHGAAMTHGGMATASLFRGHRTTDEWLRELKTVREARYRVAAVPDEELFSVLADPAADKTARAGAAVCLASAGEEARAKVRIAVEDIAAPELRAAVEAALSDDEEELARMLEAL